MREQEHAEWKTVVLDERTGEPAVPNGSVGHRYARVDEGRWNLRLDGVEPALTLLDRRRSASRSTCLASTSARARVAESSAAACRRSGSADSS